MRPFAKRDKPILITCKLSIVLSIVFTIDAAIADIAMPNVPRGDGQSCVEPTDVMRRDHMDFLMHQRDATVHDGVRTAKYSLTNCLSCHTQTNNAGEFVSINASGQFCESCHSYARVKIDCFECHATTPQKQISSGLSSDSLNTMYYWPVVVKASGFVY